MKKLYFFMLLSVCAVTAIAQDYYSSYLQKAFEYLEQGNHKSANDAYTVYTTMTNVRSTDFEQKRFEAIVEKCKKEIANGKLAMAELTIIENEEFFRGHDEHKIEMIKASLKDSIDTVFDRANRYRDANKFQLAIMEYQKLIGQDKKALKSPLYAYIGYCYEKLSDKYLSKQYYMLGIQLEEPLSALRMALYIRANREPVTSDDMIPLYLKARNYYRAMDSLGVEYGRIGNINESYRWFRRSQHDFSKYKMASYLLDKEMFNLLNEEYRTDNPIIMLTEAADNGYAPAQYYLGLLYYFSKSGDAVIQDKVKGLALMKKASMQGYRKATSMVNKINN